MAGKRMAQVPQRRPAMRKKPKKKRNPLKTVYHVIVAISAVIVALFVAFKLFIKPPSTADDQPPVPTESGAPSETEGQTVNHRARKDGYYTFLLVGTDKGHGGADTIMVASYDTVSQKVGVISVPRDTLVNVSRKVKKINASYNEGGVEQVKSEVSDLLGIPIDHYLMVNTKAFVQIVDAVGGVDFYVPVDMKYIDPTDNLYIDFRKGTQHLDGENALKVVRFRKNNAGVGYSDLGRAETQRNLVMAVAKKVLSWNSVPKMTTFLNIFAENATTDLSVQDMVWFATKALQLDTDSGVSMATLPGNSDTHYLGSRYYHGLYAEETLAIVNRLVNPYEEERVLDDMDILVVPGYNDKAPKETG